MIMKEKKYLVMDTETTGLDPKENQVLTCGFIITKGVNEVDRFEIAIKHDKYSVTAKALDVNKINLVEHEKDAYSVKDALVNIISFLSKHVDGNNKLIPIGQNIKFDIGFMESLFSSVEDEDISKAWSKLVDYRFLDLQSITLYMNLADKIETESIKLDTVIEKLGLTISNNERHTALKDAEVTLLALQKFIEMVK